MNIVQRIETLFYRQGRRLTVAGPHGTLTLLEHSLQCAELAQWLRAGDALVAAALLHDLGHLLAAMPEAEGCPVRPEIAAASFLAYDFGPEVLEPIRLQGSALPCLDGADPWAARTPPQDGGGHRPAPCDDPAALVGCDRLLASTHGRRAVLLCSFDRLAMVPGRPTPPLDHFLDIVERVLDEPPALPRQCGQADRRAAPHGRDSVTGLREDLGRLGVCMDAWPWIGATPGRPRRPAGTAGADPRRSAADHEDRRLR